MFTRKLKPPLGFADTRIALIAVARFEVMPMTDHMVLDVHELAEREQLAWFDALIVEASIRSGCSVLYSEDLAHGRRYGPLEIRNPLK